jgi:hypothetical protein
MIAFVDTYGTVCGPGRKDVDTGSQDIDNRTEVREGCEVVRFVGGSDGVS